MKYKLPIFLLIVFLGLCLAQEPIDLMIENIEPGGFIGTIGLMKDSLYYPNKLEVKAKWEQSDFFSPQQGLDWLSQESSFKGFDWSGTTQMVSWDGEGKKLTVNYGAPWRADTYTITLQPYNASGNVGDPLVASWNNYGKVEAKAEYKAENCTTPFDSTTGDKFKAEAKVKLENPKTINGMVINSDADSILITVSGAISGEVLRYKAVIAWVDPSQFGININVQMQAPSNGQFFQAGETVKATITLTNDGGEELDETDGLNNKVEKLEIWVSGPRQHFELLEGYAELKVVDKYTFNDTLGFDSATNEMSITLPADLSGREGTWVLLVRAKRKGFGPEIEKTEMVDFQVGQAEATTTPALTWATHCNDCHQLEKHKFTSIEYCVVCHAFNFEKPLYEIGHKDHGKHEIYTCGTCHDQLQGINEAIRPVCASCHNGDLAVDLPSWHSSFADESCANAGCHAMDADKAPQKVHHTNTYSGVAFCQNCHSNPDGHNQYTGWKETKHAVAFDSVAVVQDNAYCLKCHTTGWDPEKDNGGFDDYYSTGDTEGMARTKNIQCESCHKPGPAPEVSFEAETCGQCHVGDHHPTYTDWEESKHAISDVTSIPNFSWIKSNPNCAGCHTAEGFLQFVETDELEPNVVPPGDKGHAMTCPTCHDPHSEKNAEQLRLPKEELCEKCHNPEYDPNAPVPDGSEVHHSTAFMFEGKGGYQFEGFEYPSSLHKQVITEKCVRCHMYATEYVESEPPIPAYTGHKFEPQLKACTECHSDFNLADSSFDYRGVQSHIDSLLGVLGDRLAMATHEDSLSDNFLRAKFNYDFVMADGSHGIHNTDYAEALLTSSIAMFVPTGIEKQSNQLPEQFRLAQNYPNPFNPTTTIEFALPQSGHVLLEIFNNLGQKLTTLVDKEVPAGVYKTKFADSNLASGVYFYRITIRQNGQIKYQKIKKMLLLK